MADWVDDFFESHKEEIDNVKKTGEQYEAELRKAVKEWMENHNCKTTQRCIEYAEQVVQDARV